MAKKTKTGSSVANLKAKARAPKAGSKPTPKPTPKADKPSPKPKADAPAQYGVERSHDLPWNAKKVAVFKALKALGATSTTQAVTAQQVVAKDSSLTTRDVRHYCYHARAAGLVDVVEVEGVAGYCFHLTAAGAKVNLKTVLADK